MGRPPFSTAQGKDGYKALAAAIILRAVYDFQNINKFGQEGQDIKAVNKITAIEFFKSAWCEDICEYLGVDYRNIEALMEDKL